VPDIRRKSVSVGEDDDHVIYFDRRTAHGHAQLAEPPFPPTDVDPFALHFEIGFPLTQELPAATAIMAVVDYAACQENAQA